MPETRTEYETEARTVEREIPGFTCECCGQWYDEGEAEMHEVVKDPSARRRERQPRGRFPEDLDHYIQFLVLRNAEPVRMLGQEQPVDYCGEYQKVSLHEALREWQREQGMTGSTRIEDRQQRRMAERLPDEYGRLMFQVDPPEAEVRGERRTMCEHCWDAWFDD
ncbi:hypothetical protein M201_gp65 [Haloarcula californiae tailed virus 2]|uniref:Uncharacterized protein n=1 Tax=Haloarcula californiae tailed virus 2 TaxID=1273747 RepID=R4T7S9_9CAUD|nr:hypothetical protein M201_gp65 [Haloarcula californiae tailed virus 2]AGM11834.1 hypothetical protein HCTV2_65 [Haloarcula californiae tailed virus 2]